MDANGMLSSIFIEWIKSVAEAIGIPPEELVKELLSED